MEARTILVWDLPQRLFHWALASLVLCSWLSAEAGGVWLKYHFWSGYAICTLVFFRLLWGFVGSRHARFSDFVRGPANVRETVRALFSNKPLPYVGHNPLGGWMVLALLGGLAFQFATGLFANDDIMSEGPLYRHVSKGVSDFLTEVHELNFGLLATLIGVHVAAIAWHRLRKGENLARAMVTGRKSVEAGEESIRPAPWWLAVFALLLSAALVRAIITL